MNDELPLQFKGAPGSPYTRKMLAILRYRHLPYRFLVGNEADRSGLPQPKVGLIPTFYLKDEAGELQAVTDSTPLLRRFEASFSGRSVIPAHPVSAFLDYLLEDYGDEWLTKAMFHYRWYYPADIEKAGLILPLWRSAELDADSLQTAAEYIRKRQIDRLYVVGSNDTTAPVIEASYRRFLDVFDGLLQTAPFLFGGRPASSDFALYAQLTQLAKFDPTPAAICLQHAPRVHAWVDRVDDLSGLQSQEDDWLPTVELRERLGGLFAEVGRVYVPALLANAQALAAGDAQWQATIDGQPWEQPTFPYQGKCLRWIRQQFAALAADEQAAVRSILDGSGCEPLLD